MKHVDDTPRIRCPRCRYDQRGVVSTWKEHCPLAGTCSECGLIFDWAEVLCPEKFEPQWCVEFAPQKRRVPMACIKTFFRSFNPWRFWSRLKMSQPIRPWRLAMYVSSMLLPFVVCYVLLLSALAIYTRYNMPQRSTAWLQQLKLDIAAVQLNLLAMQQASQLRSASMQEIEQWLDANIPEQLIDRRWPLNAAAIKWLVNKPPDELETQIQSNQSSISRMLAQSAAPPAIKQSYWGAIAEAVVFPFANQSWGFIQLADGTTIPYPTPVQSYAMLTNTTYRGAYFPWEYVISEELIAGSISVILLTILLPASLVLLPVSRRRAKVRWPHIGRMLIYSTFALESAMVLLVINSVLSLVNSANELAASLTRWSLVAIWIILPVWWAVAIKRYLRMPHAAAIAGLMTLILALLMAPLLAFVMPHWLVRLVLR